MSKKLVSFILTLAMVLSMVPMFGTVAFAIPSNWSYLSNVMSLGECDPNDVIEYKTTTAAVGGKYTTECSITLLTDVAYDMEGNVSLCVPEGMDVTIDLNGYKIDRGLSEEGSATSGGFVIEVNSGASLTITDESTSGSGKITGGNNIGNGGGVYVNKNGILIMSGGAISGNTATTGAVGNKLKGYGGGVYVAADGKLIMSGGAISNNNADMYGGGVYVSGGSFTMSGNSKIMHNVATSFGGGVYIRQGYFTMFGASEIAYNQGSGGGGVYFLDDSTFTMTGNSTISYNVGTGACGGVFFSSNNNSIITLGGMAKITGNVKGGLIENGRLTGGTPHNVHLPNKKYIQLGTDADAPKTGMSVGITTMTSPTKDTPVLITTNGACDVKYFFSDIPKYYVSFAENHLELKPITITFDSNGGRCASVSAIVSTEGKLAELPTATRNGYTFNGWYTLASGGENITTSTVFTSDTAIYAQWTEIPTPPAPVYGGDVTYYDVVTSAGANGTIDVDKKSASSGTTVTVTVTPEKGFALETLTVLDKNGKEIEVKDTKEKNKYTFRMPSSKVTVKATFMEDNTMLNYCVDVKKEDYFYDSVLWAYGNEICNGTDELHFSPKKTLTRAEAVTMLWRIAGKPVVNYWMRFKDVESGRYYTEAVRWAASEKIAVGYSDEKFGTTDLITREQLATMIYGYVQKKGQGFTGSWMFLLPYEDRAKISDWANEAAHWCSMKGVINGKDGNLFDPQGTATRAEAVTMLYRFDSLMK